MKKCTAAHASRLFALLNSRKSNGSQEQIHLQQRQPMQPQGAFRSLTPQYMQSQR